MRNMASVFLLAAACGSSSSGNKTDSGIQPDQPQQIDAAVDGAMATGDHNHYVVDKVNIPTSNAQASMYGLDLDGDAAVDNQLGSVLATFASMGFNPQPLTDQAVDRGTILMLTDIQTSSFTSATAAGFSVYQGTNPVPAPCTSSSDTVCRHHLAGTGMFGAAATPRDPALVGNFSSGTLMAGPGHVALQVTLGAAPFTIELIGARVKVTATSTSITSGVVAGGVTQNDLNTKVFPALQVVLMGTVSADCTNLASPPTCGCATGSGGATVIGLFDANHDCNVSVQEIMNNGIIASLFMPDVTLEGQQALSVGVGFTAVPGTFTP